MMIRTYVNFYVFKMMLRTLCGKKNNSKTMVSRYVHVYRLYTFDILHMRMSL